MNQNLDIFSFESNVFIKYILNIFWSFKRIGDIGMLKSLFLILHDRRAVGKIVGNKTGDITFDELKKCGKFETALVSSSQCTSE